MIYALVMNGSSNAYEMNISIVSTAKIIFLKGQSIIPVHFIRTTANTADKANPHHNNLSVLCTVSKVLNSCQSLSCTGSLVLMPLSKWLVSRTEKGSNYSEGAVFTMCYRRQRVAVCLLYVIMSASTLPEEGCRSSTLQVWNVKLVL